MPTVAAEGGEESGAGTGAQGTGALACSEAVCCCRDVQEPRCATTTVSDDRRRRTTQHPTPGPHNSLHRWYAVRSPVRVVVNYLVILVVRVSPSLGLKRWLLRRLGVAVGDNVAWGLESTPDVFWPDLITVEDDAIIGYDATILCHEFLTNEYRTGPVVVREGAMIGAKTVVLPGVEVGANAQVAANSLVAADVPPGETVAGVPAAPVGEDSP